MSPTSAPNLHAVARTPPATRFEYDARTAKLRAIAVVDSAGSEPRAASIELLRRVVDKLNRATEGENSHMRGGGRFELDAARRELVLTREFDLHELSFALLLISLRRLDRVASNWASMRLAHVGEAMQRFLPLLHGELQGAARTGERNAS